MLAFTCIGTDQTPAVTFDPSQGIFEITGRSLTDRAEAFYRPLIDWLKSYSNAPNQQTDFVFRLEYFNADSGKYIFDILAVLEKIKGTHVVWSYPRTDQYLEESGLDFAELIDMPFTFKSY